MSPFAVTAFSTAQSVPQMSPATPDSVAPVQATESTEDKAQEAPSSPPMPSQPYNPKDRRAFEHDRQRAKRQAQRARKEQGTLVPLFSKSVGSQRKAVSPWKTAKFTDDDMDTSVDNGIAEGRALFVADERVSDGPRNEVKLADLISTAKTTRKRKDSDFEVVPHIRSVVALDDFATRDLNADEPWEHIYPEDDDSSDDQKPHTLTYADILSASK